LEFEKPDLLMMFIHILAHCAPFYGRLFKTNSGRLDKSFGNSLGLRFRKNRSAIKFYVSGLNPTMTDEGEVDSVVSSGVLVVRRPIGNGRSDL